MLRRGSISFRALYTHLASSLLKKETDKLTPKNKRVYFVQVKVGLLVPRTFWKLSKLKARKTIILICDCSFLSKLHRRKCRWRMHCLCTSDNKWNRRDTARCFFSVTVKNTRFLPQLVKYSHVVDIVVEPWKTHRSTNTLKLEQMLEPPVWQASVMQLCARAAAVCRPIFQMQLLKESVTEFISPHTDEYEDGTGSHEVSGGDAPNNGNVNLNKTTETP